MKTVLSNEGRLIERARRRDEPAFAQLVTGYTPMLYRIVRRMVPDTLEAESILQETFWRLWNVLPRYDASRPLLPYLATIAANLARDRYRRERRIADVDVDLVLDGHAGPELEIEEKADQKYTLHSLAEAVESLPFAYRAVIALRYEADMGYEEIARTLALPLNTVRTHLRRAKDILRRQMEEAHNGQDG
jgi:RNA polymerase sigma-70 factor (ECF subfamily)